MKELKQLVISEFEQRFGHYPDFVVRAPGRVNLIGEHTDYNDGFVMPMAINRAIWIALSPRNDRRVVLHSREFTEPSGFSLDKIAPCDGWESYIRGTAWSLHKDGYPLEGWEGILASDIPVSAGLSSSAALELATARAFCVVSGWEWDPVKMAFAAKRVENEWLGLQTGIMDQMISSIGQEGHALLINCRDLSIKAVPLPKKIAIIILDTTTRRGLVNSEYNQRVAQCNTASDFFNVPALRDVSLDLFKAQSGDLDEITRRRARHVITENARVVDAVVAMENDDAVVLGKLMNASHISLRDDYEVSSKELNDMVESAQSQPGCFGARMTGAGFGGCAVALVKSESSAIFSDNVAASYREKTGFQPNVYICQSTNGAELVDFRISPKGPEDESTKFLIDGDAIISKK